MSMYHDVAWRERGNTERCEYSSQTVAEYARRFPRGHWSFLRPGSEKNWNGTYTDKPDGSRDRMAENMMTNFSESRHPIFRASSAFQRGELRSKGGRKKSIHFDSDENIELLLRTVISANQLSIYGAVADLCDEVPKDLRAPVKLAAPDHLEMMEIPTRPSAEETQTNAQQRETWCKNTSENSNSCPKTRNYPNYALMRVWSLSKKDFSLDTEEGQEMQHLCREYTMPRNERKTRVKGWILKNTRIGPVMNIKSLPS